MTSQYAYPYAPQPRKRRIWPWVLLGVLLTVVLLFAGCAALIGGAAKSVSDAATTVHHVTYQVETSGPNATILYDTSTPSGVSNATATGVKSGWSIEVDHAGITGPMMTATLENLFSNKQRNATITCRILSGGKVVKENRGQGQNASVSCQASPQELDKVGK